MTLAGSFAHWFVQVSTNSTNLYASWICLSLFCWVLEAENMPWKTRFFEKLQKFEDIVTNQLSSKNKPSSCAWSNLIGVADGRFVESTGV